VIRNLVPAKKKLLVAYTSITEIDNATAGGDKIVGVTVGWQLVLSLVIVAAGATVVLAIAVLYVL
jgi:hypothetical protein